MAEAGEGWAEYERLRRKLQDRRVVFDAHKSNLKRLHAPLGVRVRLGTVTRLVLPFKPSTNDAAAISLSLFDCSTLKFTGRTVTSPLAQLHAHYDSESEREDDGDGKTPVEAYAHTSLDAFFVTFNAHDKRFVLAVEVLIRIGGNKSVKPAGWLPIRAQEHLFSPHNRNGTRLNRRAHTQQQQQQAGDSDDPPLNAEDKQSIALPVNYGTPRQLLWANTNSGKLPQCVSYNQAQVLVLLQRSHTDMNDKNIDPGSCLACRSICLLPENEPVLEQNDPIPGLKRVSLSSDDNGLAAYGPSATEYGSAQLYGESSSSSAPATTIIREQYTAARNDQTSAAENGAVSTAVCDRQGVGAEDEAQAPISYALDNILTPLWPPARVDRGHVSLDELQIFGDGIDQIFSNDTCTLYARLTPHNGWHAIPSLTAVKPSTDEDGAFAQKSQVARIVHLEWDGEVCQSAGARAGNNSNATSSRSAADANFGTLPRDPYVVLVIELVEEKRDLVLAQGAATLFDNEGLPRSMVDMSLRTSSERGLLEQPLAPPSYVEGKSILCALTLSHGETQNGDKLDIYPARMRHSNAGPDEQTSDPDGAAGADTFSAKLEDAALYEEEEEEAHGTSAANQAEADIEGDEADDAEDEENREALGMQGNHHGKQNIDERTNNDKMQQKVENTIESVSPRNSIQNQAAAERGKVKNKEPSENDQQSAVQTSESKVGSSNSSLFASLFARKARHRLSQNQQSKNDVTASPSESEELHGKDSQNQAAKKLRVGVLRNRFGFGAGKRHKKDEHIATGQEGQPTLGQDSPQPAQPQSEAVQDAQEGQEQLDQTPTPAPATLSSDDSEMPQKWIEPSDGEDADAIPNRTHEPVPQQPQEDWSPDDKAQLLHADAAAPKDQSEHYLTAFTQARDHSQTASSSADTKSSSKWGANHVCGMLHETVFLERVGRDDKAALYEAGVRMEQLQQQGENAMSITFLGFKQGHNATSWSHSIRFGLPLPGERYITSGNARIDNSISDNSFAILRSEDEYGTRSNEAVCIRGEAPQSQFLLRVLRTCSVLIDVYEAASDLLLGVCEVTFSPEEHCNAAVMAPVYDPNALFAETQTSSLVPLLWLVAYIHAPVGLISADPSDGNPVRQDGVKRVRPALEAHGLVEKELRRSMPQAGPNIYSAVHEESRRKLQRYKMLQPNDIIPRKGLSDAEYEQELVLRDISNARTAARIMSIDSSRPGTATELFSEPALQNASAEQMQKQITNSYWQQMYPSDPVHIVPGQRASTFVFFINPFNDERLFLVRVLPSDVFAPVTREAQLKLSAASQCTTVRSDRRLYLHPRETVQLQLTALSWAGSLDELKSQFGGVKYALVQLIDEGNSCEVAQEAYVPIELHPPAVSKQIVIQASEDERIDRHIVACGINNASRTDDETIQAVASESWAAVSAKKLRDCIHFKCKPGQLGSRSDVTVHITAQSGNLIDAWRVSVQPKRKVSIHVTAGCPAQAMIDFRAGGRSKHSSSASVHTSRSPSELSIVPVQLSLPTDADSLSRATVHIRTIRDYEFHSLASIIDDSCSTLLDSLLLQIISTAPAVPRSNMYVMHASTGTRRSAWLQYSNQYQQRQTLRCESSDETIAVPKASTIVAAPQEQVEFEVVFQPAHAKNAAVLQVHTGCVVYILLKDADGAVEEAFKIRCIHKL